MLALGVVDQHHRGLGNGGQLGNLAGVVHAQLQHRHAVMHFGVLAQPQHLQGQADVVVEVAGGGERRVALPGLQDGPQHLGDGGLAIAARDRDHGQPQAGAPAPRQLLQGQPGIGHLQARQATVGQATLGQRRRSAGGARLGQKVMRVEALAAQGHEQVARLQAAAVAVHPQQRRGRVAPQQGLRQKRRRLAQAHQRQRHAAPRCASHCCATALSRKGRLTPCASW